jgi:hypothetical protein
MVDASVKSRNPDFRGNDVETPLQERFRFRAFECFVIDVFFPWFRFLQVRD